MIAFHVILSGAPHVRQSGTKSEEDAVKADPAFQAAFAVNDYMRLFQLQNKIFDSQGDYTSVAIRGEYSAYTMIGHDEMSYDQYVIGFNRLLARMRELGIVMDPIDVTPVSYTHLTLPTTPYV